MLEKVDLGKKLPKSEYARVLPDLQRRLFVLQRACKQAEIASLIVFEGWHSAGKGSAIRKLTERMDPRIFNLHAIRDPRTYEAQLPWMWRYWDKLPNWGEMAIFDRSWYSRVLVERVDGLVDEGQWRLAYRSINEFERALADDRYVLVKLFLHVSQKEQRRRLARMEKDPLTRWKVESRDWQQNDHYEDHRIAVEEMLEFTETEAGPWTLVEATDKRWTRHKIFVTLIRRLEAVLEAGGHPVPDYEPEDDEDDPAAES